MDSNISLETCLSILKELQYQNNTKSFCVGAIFYKNNFITDFLKNLIYLITFFQINTKYSTMLANLL